MVCGCGGKSDGSTSSSSTTSTQSDSAKKLPPMTQAKFITRSNAFCNGSRRYLKEKYAGDHHGDTGAPARFYASPTVELVLSTLQFWYDDIISLRRPPGDEREIEGLLRTVQLTVETGFTRPAIHSARQLSTLFRRSNRLMRRYGIQRCIVRQSFPYD